MSDETNFYASIALSARRLSNCKRPEGAVIISGGRVAAYGHNQVIADEHELSALKSAFLKCQPGDLPGALVLCTRFPSKSDMELIMGSGVSKVGFFGPIEGTDTVQMVNAFTEKFPNRLEIVKLESGSPS